MNVEFGQMVFDIYKKYHVGLFGFLFFFLFRATMVNYVNKLLFYFLELNIFDHVRYIDRSYLLTLIWNFQVFIHN